MNQRKMTTRLFHFLCLVLLALSLQSVCWAQSLAKSPPPVVGDFLSKHCYECHDDVTTKGDLNLLDLEFAPWKTENFKKWEYVFERVKTGEMPPRKKTAPPSGEKKGFLSVLEKPLHKADEKRRNEEGRVNVRRLTRREYEFTLHDLLGIDIPLASKLPEDPVAHGFETVAEVQQLSHHHLARYLEVADVALDEAFGRVVAGEEKFSKTVAALDLGRGKKWGGGNYRGPETRGSLSIFWPITVQFYGRMRRTAVPESGWYRITLEGVRAINPPKGKPVWGMLRSGACQSSAPMMFDIGQVEATLEKKNLEFDAWIERNHMLQFIPSDSRLKRAPSGARGGEVAYTGPRHESKGISGIGLNQISIKRIYPNAKRWEVREGLIGKIKNEELAKLKSEKDKGELFRKTIHQFANRAFRRPTDVAQIEPYVALAIETLRQQGETPASALRTAYRGILCSPHFLTLVEKPGKLDEHALACRLSYMLWNSMPDGQLRKLADQGKLKDPKIFSEQLQRLLNDEKSNRFVTSFTDQWLNLKAIDETTPDRRIFSSYDPLVQASILQETRAFVRELFQKNLSVTNLILSDFTFLNERLAAFYGLPDNLAKTGQGLQKVKLEEPLRRGGLVTHGSVLKVTANGTTTSPVVRGVWVGERILGLHIPPPPPDIPAVEPDIRGAVSIRDQLHKHRNSESCMGCHDKIDPAGFALENYDPVGRWRTQYGKGKSAAKVDPSGFTPDGKKFGGIQRWKEIYAAQPELLAENLGKQLLTYATGASARFSDRDDVAKIVRQAREKNYGVRTILHAVVFTDAFRTK